MLTKFENNDTIFGGNAEKEYNVVKYLPEDLKLEYKREIKACPNIQQIAYPFINVSDILKAYFILAHYFRDDSTGQEVEAMLVGVKNRGLLASAVGRQCVSFGDKTKYTVPLDICSTLFYGLVKNHAFHDGNKRVSLLILIYQLHRYGFYPSVPVKEFEKLVVAVAGNALPTEYKNVWKKFSKRDDAEVHTIAYIVKRMVERKDHSYHISINTSEFCEVLEGNGIKCRVDNGKLHMFKEPQGALFWKKDLISHTVVFGGWSRVLGAKTVRETLEKFGIYDQHPSYKSIMDGKEPFYKLVADFEEPLRRLKDK